MLSGTYNGLKGSPGGKKMQRVATGFGLIEGPVWDPGRGLYFSDVINGGVHLLDRAGAVSPVIPKRRGIGGMALHASGGLVVGGRDIAFVAPGRRPHALAALPGRHPRRHRLQRPHHRSRRGASMSVRSPSAVFGGDAPKPGHLHVIDLDGTMRTLSDGVMLTNGLGFSPDGERLYHSDARAPLVRVYDVAAGRLARPVAHIRRPSAPTACPTA